MFHTNFSITAPEFTIFRERIGAAFRGAISYSCDEGAGSLLLRKALERKRLFCVGSDAGNKVHLLDVGESPSDGCELRT